MDAAFFEGGAEIAEFGFASDEIGGRGRELEAGSECWRSGGLVDVDVSTGYVTTDRNRSLTR